MMRPLRLLSYSRQVSVAPPLLSLVRADLLASSQRPLLLVLLLAPIPHPNDLSRSPLKLVTAMLLHLLLVRILLCKLAASSLGPSATCVSFLFRARPRLDR